MINLCENQLIKWWEGTEKEKTERILWVDLDNTCTYVIDIFADDSLPVLRMVGEIETAFENKEAAFTQNDPYAQLSSASDFTEKERAIRDKALRVISPLIAEENEPDIFKRDKRGSMIKSVMEEHGIIAKTVYKYLRKYWQRGKFANALLPDYSNSGGKGKKKTPGEKKLGRPRSISPGKGINVDEATKRIFRIAVEKYYDTTDENYFTIAYENMIKDYYREDYIFEDGVKKTILVSSESWPTIGQFRYWYENDFRREKGLEARKGTKNYQLKHRAVTGRSDADVIGPGSKFQIDATVADIYLVSRYNRDWVIGRPVIYTVIDCFSRIVTGLYVGLEGPSWIGAMMALSNALSDKVSYCKEYGININKEDWPCYHAPRVILGDRGELESKYADSLANGLKIRIENTPPYRADWKGIIERYFKTLNEYVKPLVPGHIKIDFRQRGGKDYRLDAKLDIYQFTQIIIKSVLHHNNEHWMKSYEADEMMVGEDVELMPRNLWNWGIVNRSGSLRVFSKNIVKLNLMPEDNVLVTESGIKYKNMYYSCDEAIKEMWFEKSRNWGSWSEKIAFDPRNMNYIYIKKDGGRSYIKCYMLDKQRYGNKTLDEIEYMDRYERIRIAEHASDQMQSKVDLNAYIENIVEIAEKMTEENRDASISNNAKVIGIQHNRHFEKMENRKTEAFELDEENKKENCNQKAAIENSKTDDFNYPSNIEYLKKKQKERMHGNK